MNEIQIKCAHQTKRHPQNWKTPNKQMKEEDETFFEIVKEFRETKKRFLTHPLRETDHEWIRKDKTLHDSEGRPRLSLKYFYVSVNCSIVTTLNLLIANNQTKLMFSFFNFNLKMIKIN